MASRSGGELYAIVGYFDVAADQRQSFLTALLENLAGALRDEPGTLSYIVTEDATIPHRFYLHEVYRDRTAFEHHGAGEYVRHFLMAARNTLILPPVVLGHGTALYYRQQPVPSPFPQAVTTPEGAPGQQPTEKAPAGPPISRRAETRAALEEGVAALIRRTYRRRQLRTLPRQQSGGTERQ